MKVVWSWLLELCELERDTSPEEAAAALTDLGLEVEGVERTGEGISGVVVAEVAWKKKHPNADKLTLVGVRDVDGGEITEVVCGAPNVPEPGAQVVWAKPGSQLPGGFKIGSKKLKGIESAGMLCAEDEIGISDDHEGIIVLDERHPLGLDALMALHLGEIVFDIGIPANRGDCLGHLGVARELVAAVGGRLKPWASPLADLTDASLQASDLVSVDIADPTGCPRYIARIIDGVTLAPSPRWMRERLRAVGVRAISNLVDVGNYVMFELGQPLHAFDYATVDGQRIVVERAGDKYRSMKTLDDVERELHANDLLICDGSGPVALAGVMGGLESEVQASTGRLLLETASFEPLGIRRTARRLGLHSESSHRFERSVDIVGAERASQRAAQLLAQVGGGRVAAGVVDNYPSPAPPHTVSVRVTRASELTGVEFTVAQARETLEKLELRVGDGDADSLIVEVPTFRADIEREVDLIEELIRVYGYDNVPVTLPRTTTPPPPSTDVGKLLRDALTAAGLSEAITFGFTSPVRISALALGAHDPRGKPYKLRNPMTVEQSVMRTSLLPNLLGAVSRNLKYGVRDVGLFELGIVFLPSDGELADERFNVAAVLAGGRPRWLSSAGDVDVFDLKGALVELFDALELAFELRVQPNISYLHPGVAAEVFVAGERVGVIGEVHPYTRAQFEIEVPVFTFELDLDAYLKRPIRQMRAIAKHPAVSRDVSFFVDVATPAARVHDVIAAAEQPLVERVEVLEDFRDERYVPEGKKGMLWSITYRALDRTLTDAEVDAAHEPIVAGILSNLDAQRR